MCQQPGRQGDRKTPIRLLLQRAAEESKRVIDKVLKVFESCQRAFAQELAREIAAKARLIEHEVRERSLLFSSLSDLLLQSGFVPLEFLIEVGNVLMHDACDVFFDLAEDGIERTDGLLKQTNPLLQHVQYPHFNRLITSQVVNENGLALTDTVEATNTLLHL